MHVRPTFVTLFAAIAALSLAPGVEAADPASELDDLIVAFEARTGARLVFDAAALPDGDWFDIKRELPAARRIEAARLALAEARRYPEGYLGEIGLCAVGVFDGLASAEGDGFRPWSDRLGGYRYFGQWNGADAVIAAFYTDEQLPLTFHHEVFHHVGARTDDDDRFAAAIAGDQPYPAATISDADLALLEARATGEVLDGAVSDYAAKSAGEDQAETARYLMSALPDALIQIARQPELPGSQRLLHVLGQYAAASPKGPDLAWLVDLALDRAGAAARGGRAVRDNPHLSKVDDAIADPTVRAAIRAVQPATVRLGGGSGVNLDPRGVILTAAHVVDQLGARLTVHFPDGTTVEAETVALDATLDLAVLTVDGGHDLPAASLAAIAPSVGDTVVVIGQPGRWTPDGDPTGYLPWHVSVGEIRGFRGDPLDDQSLGGTKHDAWTYWGHSGSPLFDTTGHIVALHNSWDSATAMRHAIPHEALADFLARLGGQDPGS